MQGELRFARARTAADLDEACGKTSSQAAIDLPQSRGDAHLDRFKFRIVDVKDPLQKKTLRGSFSAISKPILQVNTKHSLESSWRDLQDLHASFGRKEPRLKMK